MPEPETSAGVFLETVIRPVLLEMGMYSPAAAKLLVLTACHESMGFRFRRQEKGPALSFFQIEPDTLADLYDNYLHFRPSRQLMLDAYLPQDMRRLVALETLDNYACAAARLIYARVPEPLPDVADTAALAAYAKRFWNTRMGAATAEKYISDFGRYGPAPQPVDWC